MFKLLKMKGRKEFLIVFFLLLFVSAAFATGVFYRADGTAGSGMVYDDKDFTSAVDAGSLVEYYPGGETGAIGEGASGADGKLYRFVANVGVDVSAKVRVWNQAQAGEGQNVRYGYSTPLTIGNSPTPVPYNIGNFWLNYIAAAPEPPVITNVEAPGSLVVDPASVGYDAAKISWSLNTANYEISGVQLSYGEDAAATDKGSVAGLSTGSSGNYTFGELLGGMKLEPNKTYYIKMRAKNQWKNPLDQTEWGSWSQIYTMNTKSLPEGVLQIDPGTITLRNGINFISMPFNRKDDGSVEWYAYDGATGNAINAINGTNKLTTPQELVTVINALSVMNQNPAQIISTFGRWVEDGQPGQTSDKGVLFENKNPNQIAKGSWQNVGELKAERGYQVYISGLGANDTLQLKIYSAPQEGGEL